MTDTKSTFTVMLLAWIPYSAVAWGYKVLTDGTATTFWYALGALVAARLFFGIIEMLGGILAYRVYGKRASIKMLRDLMRENKFPKRKYAEESFEDYLDRIKDDPDCEESVKKATNELRIVLIVYARTGLLVGMRIRTASEAAFDIYSPVSDAPSFAD